MNIEANKAGGLEGVIAAVTNLSEVDGVRGELIVAGERIGDLAAHTGYEGLAARLWSIARGRAIGEPETRRWLGQARLDAFERMEAVWPALDGLSMAEAFRAGVAAVGLPANDPAPPEARIAGPLAAMMLADLLDGDIAARIRDRVALGQPIPGFGHTIYRNGDPRADVLLAALVRAGADPRLAIDAPALITEATGLYPTIDFALAILMRMFDLPIGHEMSLFAIARSAGWVGHAIEQLESGVLIRPRARYVGPQPGRGDIGGA